MSRTLPAELTPVELGVVFGFYAHFQELHHTEP
jgi:hypothetical protein